MSILVTPTIEFRDNVTMALQQTSSKLWPLLMPMAANGELTEITDLVVPVQPQTKTARFQPTGMTAGEHERRWCAIGPERYFERTADNYDKLKSRLDIGGTYTKAAAATIARAKDMAFLEGFYGTALTGKVGGTAVPFAAGNIVAANVGAGGATGLNVEKLRAAQEILTANFVDLEADECYMVINARQQRNLQSEAQMINYDFNKQDEPVLRSGKLTKLLGFNFVVMEFGNATSMTAEVAALTVDGSSNRRVPFWAKSGMAGVTWEDMFARVSEREDAHFAVQAYARTVVAASRTEEGKCGQVLCSEA